MAGYKETPRQKMIGMMYLVLTALLALNVSKEMLDAFVVVNDSVELTNENFTHKLDETYTQFNKQYQLNQTKVKPFWDKGQEARRLSNNLVNYIDSIKYELIAKTEKIPVDSAKVSKIGDLKNKDDYDTPTNFFMGGIDPGKKGEGVVLKKKIDEYRDAMLNLLSDDEKNKVKLGLITDGSYHDADGAPQDWIMHNFYHTILVADVAILNKIISEVYNAEFDIVNYLLNAIDATDFKYDEVDAKVLPKSNYIFLGEEYQAEVIVAAYSTTQNPEVYIKMGVDSLPVSQKSSATKVEGRNGKVAFQFPANAEGTHKYAGFVMVKSGEGSESHYFFNDEYTVSKPSATVSAAKMNVFYIGVDNPVDISVPGVANEKLTPSITKGTLVKDMQSDSWIFKINKAPEKDFTTTISIFAEMDGSSKKMGESTFRLKKLPDPIAKIAGKMEGGISQYELSQASRIVPIMPVGFDFDIQFEILSFDMIFRRGDYNTRKGSDSELFSEEMKKMIDGLQRGQRVTFEKIMAKGPDGETRLLNPISFTIK